MAWGLYTVAMKESPVPNWPAPMREPIVRGLLLSACLHLAALALIQPSPDSLMARTVVINARLAPVAPRNASPMARTSETPVAPPKTDVVPRLEHAHETPAAPPEPESRTVVMESKAPSPLPTPDSAPRIATPKREPEPPAPQAASVAGSASAKGAASPAAGSSNASASPGHPLGIDTTWYSFRQLDSPPSALEKIEPDYPHEARRKNQEGSVKILIRIDDLGRVQSAEVVEAHPAGLFDEAALKAARKTRFQPAIKDGRPVRSEGHLRMEFKLED